MSFLGWAGLGNAQREPGSELEQLRAENAALRKAWTDMHGMRSAALAAPAPLEERVRELLAAWDAGDEIRFPEMMEVIRALLPSPPAPQAATQGEDAPEEPAPIADCRACDHFRKGACYENPGRPWRVPERLLVWPCTACRTAPAGERGGT